MLQSMQLQRVGQDWVTELNWTDSLLLKIPEWSELTETQQRVLQASRLGLSFSHCSPHSYSTVYSTQLPFPWKHSHLSFPCANAGFLPDMPHSVILSARSPHTPHPSAGINLIHHSALPAQESLSWRGSAMDWEIGADTYTLSTPCIK